MDYAKLFAIDKSALPLRVLQPRRTHCVAKPAARHAHSSSAAPSCQSARPAKPVIGYRLSDRHPFALKIRAAGPSLYERARQLKALQKNEDAAEHSDKKQQDTEQTDEVVAQENVQHDSENARE